MKFYTVYFEQLLIDEFQSSFRKLTYRQIYLLFFHIDVM